MEEKRNNFQRLQFKPKSNNPRDNYKWELCFPPTSRLGVTIKDYNGQVYTHMSLLSRQENKRAVSISFRSDEMELLITSIPEIEKCLAECARAIRRPPPRPIEGYTTINRPEAADSDADDEMSEPIPRSRRPATTRKVRKVFADPEASAEVAQPAKKRKPKQSSKKGITQRLVEEDSNESSTDEAPPPKRRSNVGKQQQQQNNAPPRRIIQSDPSSSSDESSEEEGAPPATKQAAPRGGK